MDEERVESIKKRIDWLSFQIDTSKGEKWVVSMEDVNRILDEYKEG